MPATSSSVQDDNSPLVSKNPEITREEYLQLNHLRRVKYKQDSILPRKNSAQNTIFPYNVS